MSSRLTLSLVVAILLAAHGCAPESEHPVAPTPDSSPLRSEVPKQHPEGELLGNVFVGDEASTSNAFTLLIEPVDSATIDRLAGTLFSTTQWANPAPTAGYSIEYFNPQAEEQDPCPNSYEAYLSGDTTLMEWGDEVHYTSPGVNPPGKERHCIIPGQYRV